jgi:hypothetical protein
MVCGVWCVVCGVWCVVCGVYCLVHHLSRLIQRSRVTVRMLQHFQKLSQSLSWFNMSANVSEVVSQVLNLLVKFGFLSLLTC